MGRGGKTALGVCRDSTRRTKWPAVGGLTRLMFSWMTSMVLVEKFANICAMSASHEWGSVSQRQGRQMVWLVCGSLHTAMMRNTLPCILGVTSPVVLQDYFPCPRCNVGQEGAFCVLFISLNYCSVASSSGERSSHSAEVHALQEDPASCRSLEGPGSSPSFPAPSGADFLHSDLHSTNHPFFFCTFAESSTVCI